MANSVRKQRPITQPFNFKETSDKIRSLAAITVASNVAYLRLRDLAGLDSLEVDSFVSGRVEHRLYREGELIYPSSDKGPSLFILRRGTINILRPRYQGQSMFIKRVEQGTIFGEMPSIGQTMLGSEAEADELSEVAILGMREMEDMLLTFSGLAASLLHHLGPRLVDAEKRHERAAFHTVNSRIASLLLERAVGREVVGIYQKNMSELVGVYRESVTAAIAHLKRAGLIKVNRGRITLLDPLGLRALSLL